MPKKEPHTRTLHTLLRMVFACTRTCATAHHTCACAHAPWQPMPCYLVIIKEETDKTSKMKETEEIELQELNELNEVEVLSDEEIKRRKKWIEDAEKSGRIFLIFIESFVVISIVLLVAIAAVSYEKNWLSPCIEIKSESGDVTCKTANFDFGFSTLTSLINVEFRLKDFEKFHPPQKKIPPPRLLISLVKCLILLQNLMKIFLTVILSYKTLF